MALCDVRKLLAPLRGPHAEYKLVDEAALEHFRSDSLLFEVRFGFCYEAFIRVGLQKVAGELNVGLFVSHRCACGWTGLLIDVPRLPDYGGGHAFLPRIAVTALAAYRTGQ